MPTSTTCHPFSLWVAAYGLILVKDIIKQLLRVPCLLDTPTYIAPAAFVICLLPMLSIFVHYEF
jgi:hypothetical protein